MKTFQFLLIVFLFSIARKSSAVEIQNPDIICTSKQSAMQVSINTKAAKVWLTEGKSKSSKVTEVQDAIFSGVTSNEKFEGDILGEATFKKSPVYVNINITGVEKTARLELQLSPKDHLEGDSSKMVLDNCLIK